MTKKKVSPAQNRMRRILTPIILITIVAFLLILHEDTYRRDSTGPETTRPESGQNGDTAISLTTTATQSSLSEAQTVADSVRYYIGRLGDPSYTDTYSEGFVWYIAAEELGMIGRPAIPSLIERLGTDDDYERTQALYALRLAAQHENMRTLTDGEYVNLVPDAFPPAETHPELVRAWREWYQSYF